MLKVTILNAAPDTGNLGVSALGYSIIGGLGRRIRDLSLTVADCGIGIRPATQIIDGKPFQYKRCGVRLSRRLYRPEALWNLRLAANFGGAWNKIARHLMNQDYVLDITGGDSFSDLYGPRSFQSGSQMKSLFLERGIPLGLLPQTYGPFKKRRHREIAADQIRQSQFAWARDERSYLELQNLLGDSFDPDRHHCGVDVAFLLEVVQPSAQDVGEQAMAVLSESSKPTIGLNISGLIYNDPEAAIHQYGFKADYCQVIRELLKKILAESDANVLLIPHVLAAPEHVQSDSAACRKACADLGGLSNERLVLLPEMQDPRQIKWVISNCDWFCGTRMHATIGGLSTQTPTAAIAYSLKTAGVFETCEQGDHVADPRHLTTAEMVDRLWKSWSNRELSARSLAVALPRVIQQANRQMDMIATACLQPSAMAVQ